jgi:hypothetical protein
VLWLVRLADLLASGRVRVMFNGSQESMEAFA